MNTNRRIVLPGVILRAAHVLLTASLLLVAAGCNLPGRGPAPSEAAPGSQDQTGYRQYWEGKGLRLEWDVVPPGGGDIHFTGFAYACSIIDPVKIVDVSLYGDVGDNTKFTESNQSSALTNPAVVPLVGGTAVPPYVQTEEAFLTLEGTVTTKENCVCTMAQDLHLVFEIDLQARNARIKPAFSSGGELKCPACGSNPASAAFMPMTFVSDVLVDLKPISQSDCRVAQTENP